MPNYAVSFIPKEVAPIAIMPKPCSTAGRDQALPAPKKMREKDREVGKILLRGAKRKATGIFTPGTDL